MLLWTLFSCASSLMQSRGRCCLIGGLNARYLRTSGLDQLEKEQVQALHPLKIGHSDHISTKLHPVSVTRQGP